MFIRCVVNELNKIKIDNDLRKGVVYYETVDIARFIRHIGARDFVRASSMLEDIIKKRLM